MYCNHHRAMRLAVVFTAALFWGHAGAARQAAFAAILSPSEIANLKAWYQPSTLDSLNFGDPVTAWSDSSGNGHHLSATGSTDPTKVTGLGINGYGGVNFIDAVNDPLTRAAFNNSSASTIFAVAQVLSSSPTYTIWLDGQSGRQTLYHFNDNFSIFAGIEVQNVMGTGGGNDFQIHRYMGLFNGGSSQGGIDGVESGLVNPGTDAIGTLVVGDHTNPGDGNDATLNLLELIVYDRALTLAERADVDAYLFNKFFVLPPLPVPEPSTGLMLASAALGLAGYVRRKGVRG